MARRTAVARSLAGGRDADSFDSVAGVFGARTVFVLHDVEGYRHDEIGDILGVSPGTSKSQLHRARQTLRVLLNKKAGN